MSIHICQCYLCKVFMDLATGYLWQRHVYCETCHPEGAQSLATATVMVPDDGEEE